MRKELKRLGFDTGESNHTPIVPIYIRDVSKTFFFWKKLFENGVYTNAVVAPAVAPDSSLIRTSYMATHEKTHLDKCLEIINKIGKEIGVVG